MEFSRERERNRKTKKERGEERRNRIERIEGKRNREIKELCTALCDYRLVCQNTTAQPYLQTATQQP